MRVRQWGWASALSWGRNPACTPRGSPRRQKFFPGAICYCEGTNSRQLFPTASRTQESLAWDGIQATVRAREAIHGGVASDLARMAALAGARCALWPMISVDAGRSLHISGNSVVGFRTDRCRQIPPKMSNTPDLGVCAALTMEKRPTSYRNAEGKLRITRQPAKNILLPDEGSVYMGAGTQRWDSSWVYDSVTASKYAGL